MSPAESPISDNLRRSAEKLGPIGQQWIAGLSSLVARVADQWELRIEAALDHDGHASVIYAVTTADGSEAILKLSLPHPEARWEAESLLRWAGRGAVQALRTSDDGFTLLLERCRPGHGLWTVSSEQQRNVAVELLPQLWIEIDSGHPFPGLADTAARWESEMHRRASTAGLPPAVVDRASAWSRELRDSQQLRLLHGDFHPANVLAAEREPWLVIDPKSWVGDPAFDLAQWLVNRIARCAPGDDAVAAVTDEARTLAERLNLDLIRVLRWAVVKAIGWDFGPAATVILYAAATRGR